MGGGVERCDPFGRGEGTCKKTLWAEGGGVKPNRHHQKDEGEGQPKYGR